MNRNDGRQPDQLRPVKIIPNYLTHATGSCLIEMGGTKVICSAMVEESVPGFLKGSGKGWLTAEYSMLPASSSQRIQRERQKVGGRTHEIQRLIGRSLRTCVDLGQLGERSILVDCDVVDADGGTRTASITGAYVAVALAIKKIHEKTPRLVPLIKTAVAAVSVGVVNGVPCLDLNYEEDKDAEVDMNIVRTGTNRFVEVQGTAEGVPFSDEALKSLIELGKKGVEELLTIQKRILEV
ncbi:MAG: ribonuclease PH [Proteobacteria bacterium]|nr:ribonuclease PH [Pseudomonadota bacterium]NBY19603.1 ribonuclease PH [bacterium]